MMENKKSYTNIILYFIIAILAGALLYFNLSTFKEYLSMTNISQDTGLNIGDQLQFTGQITKIEDLTKLGTYTHTINHPEFGLIGLRSKTVNMNIFTNIVTLEGRVIDIDDGIAILEVSSLMDYNPEQLSGDIISGNVVDSGETTSKRIFINEAGLAFNKEILSGLDLSIRNGHIYFSEGIKQVADMTYFECKKGKNLEDCDKIEKNLNTASATKESNVYDNVFIKFSDGNMRFSNNNDIWGYNIATNSNKYVRQIAQSVRFFDKSFILENYDKNIKSACSNQDFQTSKINDITLRLERSKLIGTVEGSTINDEKINCEVNINIDDISSFEAQILTREQNNQTGTTTQNIVETPTKNDTTSTTTTTNNTPTPAPSKLSSGSGLSFTSSKGFTIVFPSKAISFASYPAKTNLGLSNTNCSSEIKVTSSKTQDLLENSPAVGVFVCTTKESAGNLGNGLRLIKTSNGSNLIIKTYDNGRSSFAGNILAD